MKRRNFLSGFFAAPLALKARLIGLFRQTPVTPQLTPLQLQLARLLALSAQGKSMREISDILWPGSMERWAKKTAGLRAHAWLN